MSIDNWESKEFRKKFDPSKPIQTRDGREARIYETLSNATIAAFIQKHLHSPEWVFKIFYGNGRTCSPHRLQELACGDDLVNIPQKKIKKKGWINIYPCQMKSTGGLVARQSGVFNSREWARKWATHYSASPKAVATIKIEWEEEE